MRRPARATLRVMAHVRAHGSEEHSLRPLLGVNNARNVFPPCIAQLGLQLHCTATYASMACNVSVIERPRPLALPIGHQEQPRNRSIDICKAPALQPDAAPDAVGRHLVAVEVLFHDVPDATGQRRTLRTE